MDAACSWNSFSVLSHLFSFMSHSRVQPGHMYCNHLFIKALKNCGQVLPSRDTTEYAGKLLNIGFASSVLWYCKCLIYSQQSSLQFCPVLDECNQLLFCSLVIVGVLLLNHAHINITSRNEQESWYVPLVIQLRV